MSMKFKGNDTKSCRIQDISVIIVSIRVMILYIKMPGAPKSVRSDNFFAYSTLNGSNSGQGNVKKKY